METYYTPADLAKFGNVSDAAPELGEKFFDYYGAVFADGALSAREKSLIALAVAHAVQCPYCIDSYTNDALQKGADSAQLTEAIHVACAIRGGATLAHGVQSKNISEDAQDNDIAALSIFDIEREGLDQVLERRIGVGGHRYACTAGAGSSCGGSNA